MTDNDEEEKSFVDAYRSEILNKGQEKEESPLPKIISIVALVIVVSIISIVGYNYFSSDEKHIDKKQEALPVEKKHEKTKEIEEEALPVPVESMIDNIEDLESMESLNIEPVPTAISTPTPSNNNDIDQIANQMKLELSK